MLSPNGEETVVTYDIRIAPGLAIYLTFFAVLTCWTVFVPILVHRVLVHHPRALMENLLSGV